jgi:cell filamentation protein
VSSAQRKLSRARLDQLAILPASSGAIHVVPNPWRYYERDWDWIVADDGICFNWAGCLNKDEIFRREDEGVQRAMEFVANLLTREEPAALSTRLIQQIHMELMESIYPFAGSWRTVSLHKGKEDEPTRWPLPPGGIQPPIDVFERDVLSRSPFISESDHEVFRYASEAMNELLAIHPFREGNGRVAFILGNLILMQNDMLPLTTYERRLDEERYFAACDAGRIRKDYAPLAELLAEWEDKALKHWEERHG